MSTATGAPTAAPSQPVLTDEERDTVELPLWSIALGLVLGLLGSVAINTGNNLQSMGLKELQKKEELDELDHGGSDAAERPAREPSESPSSQTRCERGAREERESGEQRGGKR